MNGKAFWQKEREPLMLRSADRRVSKHAGFFKGRLSVGLLINFKVERLAGGIKRVRLSATFDYRP